MANASSVRSTFIDALNNFKANAGLDRKELADFQLTSLDALHAQIRDIQNDQRRVKKMRYMKRLMPFLNAMAQYGTIVEVFLNVSEIVAFIWGPMKLLLMITRNYANAFESLLNTYEDIGKSIPQFAQYQTLLPNNHHMQLALAYIYEDILEFHKEALRYFRHRKLRELLEAAKGSFNETIAHLSKRLRNHKSLIEGQIAIASFEEIREMRTDMKRSFQEQQLGRLDRRRFVVQRWLCATNTEARQDDATRARHARSGQWLLNDTRFAKWFSLDYCAEPLLWINGIPGAGKTVLASRIIEECRKLSPRARTCFFYCRHTDNNHSAFVSIAKALLSQLVAENDMLLQYLYENGNEVELSKTASAKAFLEFALQSCSATQKVYIIIDGLDEYDREDRKAVVSWFKEQVRKIPIKDLGIVRCLFISQDDGFARKDLSDCSSIKLVPKDTHQDIEEYCKSWHKRIADKFGPLDSKEHDIITLVTARAQGMFLYAKLVMSNLLRQPSRKQLLEEIQPDTLPDGLEQAYARIVDRTIGPTVRPQNLRDHALKLVGWLTCAKRALKWSEINGAMSIDMDHGTIDRDLGLVECKDLLASLVERMSDDSVVFVHSTARRYLIDKGHVCVPEIEFDMTQLCVAYLSLPQFVPEIRPDEIRSALFNGDYTLADYASCFWAMHLVDSLRDVLKLSSRDLNELVETLGCFLEAQWASPQKNLPISKTTFHSLSALADYEIHEKICQAVISTKNQLRQSGKGPSDDEVLHVADVMQSIRTELEFLACSSSLPMEHREKIRQFYGFNVFKCRRINCQFYSNGFPSAEQRDLHISKHERSFTCAEEGCPYRVIGFVAAQDLQKHKQEVHGTSGIGPTFPEDDSESNDDPTRRKTGTAAYGCKICGKKFTRGFNYRSHMMTHMPDRVPFPCDICRKRFSRQADRKRHERLHTNDVKKKPTETEIVCHGILKDGNAWGCGSIFEHYYPLGRHLTSDAGKSCIQPLLEEEIREKGGVSLNSQSADTQSAAESIPAVQLLPAALLVQYPALAGLQWDQDSVNDSPK